jgi:hypothetical protein
MRIRTKVLVGTGFAVGYYFGAKAGRERYEQLRKALDAVPVGAAVRKGRALADLAVERAKGVARREDAPPLRPVVPADGTADAAQLSSR